MKGKALSIGCAAAFTLCTLTPFYTMNASADNVNTRYVIGYSEFADYYDTIDAQYMDSSGVFHQTTFSLTGQPSGYVFDGYDGINRYTLANRQAMFFQSDQIISSSIYQTDWEEIRVILYPHIHISGVEYIETGFVSYMYPSSSSFYSQIYQAVAPFNNMNFTVQGVSYQIPLLKQYSNQSNPVRIGYGDFSSASYIYSGGYGSFASTSGSPTDIYIDSVEVSCIQNVANDRLYIGIFLPIVSEDAVLEEPSVYPIPDLPEYTVTGSMTGDIISNTTGYNANFDIHVNIPDYNSQFDNIQSAINPSYDSSNVDDMQSAILTGVSEEEEVMGQASTVLTSLPDSLDFDDSITSDAVGNPFETFFNENIIGIMVSWVCIIAFMSYILFGKWV